MKVLVDSSIWIDYFRKGKAASRGTRKMTQHIDQLIDDNLIVTNEIILAELLPFLQVMQQTRVADLLGELRMTPLKIDWQEIVRFQVQCLQAGANGVGIPDLLIAQNAIQNHCVIYTSDRHFSLLNEVLGLRLFPL